MKTELTALRELLEHVDRNTCTHEDTHRGGAIWTICDGCGMKWADDEGGFKPYEDAPAVARARSALSSAEEKAVEVKDKRIAQLERALAPFAAACEDIETLPGGYPWRDDQHLVRGIKFGDLRHARKTMDGTSSTDGGKHGG